MNTLTAKQILQQANQFAREIKTSGNETYQDGVTVGYIEGYEKAKTELTLQFRESVQPVSGVSVEEMAEKYADQAHDRDSDRLSTISEAIEWLNRKNNFISGYQSNTAPAGGFSREQITEILNKASFALRKSYDATEYPADGTSFQEKTATEIDTFLSSLPSSTDVNNISQQGEPC